MCDKTHLEVEADQAKAVFYAVENLAKMLAVAWGGCVYFLSHSWIWGGAAGALIWFLARNTYAKHHREMQAKLQNRHYSESSH